LTSDWQIVVDCDEFLYHENIKEELEEYKNCDVSLMNTTCYTMVSDYFPEYDGHKLYEKINSGVRRPIDRFYDKTIIFNPKKIKEINYAIGGHTCSPVGNIRIGWTGLKMLHYRFFGYEYTKKRFTDYANRVAWNEKDYAGAYVKWLKNMNTEEEYKNLFEIQENKLMKVV
jgi:hypothetical protein